MDIQTLSASMINQAAAAASAPGSPHLQPLNAHGASVSSGGDSVSISDAARAKAAASAPATLKETPSGLQSVQDTLARRIAKLQKDLQGEKETEQSFEEKADHLSDLRGQIRQLQSQQKKPGGSASADAATSFRITHV